MLFPYFVPHCLQHLCEQGRPEVTKGGDLVLPLTAALGRFGPEPPGQYSRVNPVDESKKELAQRT